ncbi:MAG: cysteine desulfurase [Clostridiales bacterium]|nr:cysteine desulfurase [Clostridiales bacterium]
MEIYLDNSATTMVCREAANTVTSMLTENYGNPSSLHRKGTEAARALEKARQNIADVLSCGRDEIFFTNSGTTANNTALFGTVMLGKHKGGRIITTSLEHPSVHECMKRLETQGFEVVYLKSNSKGEFSMQELMDAVNSNTVLVSIMAVNNEIGTVNPISGIKSCLNRKGSNALIHVDAVQAFGKIRLNPKKDGIDLMTLSSHKIHGPKGAGALYVRKGVRLSPYIVGGGQEKGIYSGTEAMPAIAGFGEAARVLPEPERELTQIRSLRNSFVNRITQIGGVFINSPADGLPYIINLSVLGVPSQTMVNALSQEGIYVSAGSACKKGHRSEVLTAIGLDPKRIDSAVRISLSRYTTENDLERVAECINKIAMRVRR